MRSMGNNRSDKIKPARFLLNEKKGWKKRAERKNSDSSIYQIVTGT